MVAAASSTLNCCPNHRSIAHRIIHGLNGHGIFRVDYGHEEAEAKFGHDPREYQILSKEFLADEEGRLRGVKTVNVRWTKTDKGGWTMEEVPGSEKEWPAQLILLAMGFLGPEAYLAEKLGIKLDQRSNYEAKHGDFTTSIPASSQQVTAGEVKAWWCGRSMKAEAQREPSTST